MMSIKLRPELDFLISNLPVTIVGRRGLVSRLLITDFLTYLFINGVANLFVDSVVNGLALLLIDGVANLFVDS